MVALGVMDEMDQCGIEASATVRRLGPNVADLRVGDKIVVCSDGLFRTRACVNQHQCIKIPPGLSLSDAATLPAVYATAFYCLITAGQLQRDQVRNLIGSCTIQLSKLTPLIVYSYSLCHGGCWFGGDSDLYGDWRNGNTLSLS